MGNKSSSVDSELLTIAKRFVALPPEKKDIFAKALKAKGLDVWAFPITSRPRNSEYFPLSFAQERLWVEEQLEEGSARYNLFFGIRFVGMLDLRILEKSLNEIIRRHEVLRTNIIGIEGHGQQRIKPFCPIDLPITDLRQCDFPTSENRLTNLARAEACHSFDLSNESVLRVRVVRCAGDMHILMLAIHHIAFDAWSVGLITDELSSLYTAFIQNQPSPLLDPHIQYVDFAYWQREWLESDGFTTQWNYWKKQMHGVSTYIAFPLDRVPPSVRSYEGAMENLTLSETLSNHLYDLSRRSRVTLYMLMLAVYQLLMSRYTGQEDVCVGTSIANRSRPETEKLLGFLVNTLVMRTSLSGDPSFLELLQRVQSVVTGALAHQDLPFEKLVELLGVPRNSNTNPLFQAFFVLENVPEEDLRIANVTIESFESDSHLVHFDLTLRIAEDHEKGRLICQLEYARELFEESTAIQLLNHYHTLLEAIVVRPESRLSELSLLSDEECRHLVVDWNAMPVSDLPDSCIHELFESYVKNYPGVPAIKFEDEVITYQELDSRANQLAHHLQGLGIGPEVRVGLCLERSLDLIIGLLAVLKAGGAYIPLDPKLPKERLRYMLRDSDTQVVLTQTSWSDVFTEIGIEHVCLDRDWQQISVFADVPVISNVCSMNVAYVIYTSGSTGRPKGVVVEHRQLVNYICGVLDRLTLEDAASFATVSTVGADLGNTSIFGALCSGRLLHVLSTERGFDPDGMAEYMHTHNVDVLKITPTHLLGLLEAEKPEQVLPRRCLILGGEAVRGALLNRIRALSVDCQIVNHYGPTETTVGVLTHRLDESSGSEASVPIGQPLSNTQSYILDQNFHPTPIGVPGELYIGGNSLARGYLQRPELTAERFLPDPFLQQSGGRLYRTGDRARYRLNETIEFLGRVDNQVKVRGFRIELDEIQAQLLALQDICDAVVIVSKGKAEINQVIAYVVGESEVELDVLIIRQQLVLQLPDYMVPYAIVVLEALPLTANGKVDRQALPEPDSGTSNKEEALVVPRTPAEETLVAIWGEVLQREQVSIYDNFFELGGDSILTLQVVARARRQGLKVTPKQMFECPTVAQLAAVSVSSATGIELPSQKALSGTVSLGPIQSWFFEAQPPNPHHWNQSLLLMVHQSLSFPLLEQAMQYVVSHHDALRMRFESHESGMWTQRYAETETHPLCVHIDLKQAAKDAQTTWEATLETLATEIHQSLDIIHGPLVKVAYFDLGEEEVSRLLLVIHHLVVDGVSWRVLIEDLQTVYGQLEQNQSLQLPLKTTSLQEWMERLRAYADSEEFQGEQDYWHTEGAKVSAMFSRHKIVGNDQQSNQTRTLSVSLSRDDTLALLQEVPSVYRTEVNDILLTGLALTLCRWSGQPSVCVELEGHGREDLFDEIDLSRTVGWFTSRFPVCLTPGEIGLGEAIQAVKGKLRGVPHKGIGYGVFRYLRQGDSNWNTLVEYARPDISYNYLGQLDSIANETARFSLAQEDSGMDRDPLSTPLYVLDVNCYVVDRSLIIDWNYPAVGYDPAIFEYLGSQYAEVLRELLVHCRDPDAGGVLPSDFPAANLTDEELNDLLHEIQ